MIQVQALETIKSDGMILHAGHCAGVPDQIAERWCAAGWARDTTGRLETGPRSVSEEIIYPHGADHRHQSQET